MPDSFDTNGSLNILEGKITTPDTLNATMNFASCPVIWQHRMWGTGDLNKQFNNGVFFYGEEGTLFASDRKLILMPNGKDKDQESMEIDTPGMQENHVANFLKAVKTKDKSLLDCPVEDAFQSTATVQLAMISYYAGSKIEWDTNEKKIVGNKEASKLMARPYRGKYERSKV